VIGEAQWEGTRWTVSRDHILLLDSKGGDGGNGGKGRPSDSLEGYKYLFLNR
jgi:hypothetical protein